MTAFHIMAKPGGALCNLQCDYCFFLPKQTLLGSRQKMSDAVLDMFIREYIACQPSGTVIFTWQGGEPTLLGIDYFRRALELQKKYCPDDKTIANDLQTNGLELDAQWCDFLKQNDFLVGVSIDGPEDLHNAYRKDPSGKGSFDKTMRAISLLRSHAIPFNTLTVLHRRNALHASKVYTFLRDEIASRYMQFIPLVEPKNHASVAPGHWNVKKLPVTGSAAARPGAPDSFVADWCVDPDDFGTFLCQVFDEWLVHDVGKVYVSLFDCFLGAWAGYPSSMCTFDKTCGRALALDSDGHVYFCDRFCYPEYRMGKLGKDTLRGILDSSQVKLLGKMKGSVSPVCKACRWAFACRGECPKNRFLLDEHGKPGLNYLCAGLKTFFAHIDPAMRHMAKQLSLQSNTL